MHKPNVRSAGALALCLLAGPLTACSGLSKPSTPRSSGAALASLAPARVPMPSASLMRPPPPGSFLERAQSDIETWDKRLTASPPK